MWRLLKKWKPLKRFADNLESLVETLRMRIGGFAIHGSAKFSDVDPDLSKIVGSEDIPDIAAKPEDANPEFIGSAGDQSKDANPEAIRYVTGQLKDIEDPTSKERLNASTKGKGVAIEATEDTGATRSKRFAM
ncbi:hypothetical protein BGZ47_006294 [Haplosporangium gracile]|nr:hypothetical protein BGZ47_006294 [Haplosporangium gracile]